MDKIRYKTIFNTEKIYPTKKHVKIYYTPVHVVLNASRIPTQKTKNKKQNHLSSLMRTKNTIRDIIICNNFKYFATFTFANDRDDVGLCKKRMQVWLKQQQKHYGSFDYVIVPEYHKDKKALHFHALISPNFRGKLKPAINTKTNKPITTKQNVPIFTFKGWRNGFSHCRLINNTDTDRTKLANYVTKYITKDMPTFTGKKRYWCTTGLIRPLKNNNIELTEYIDQPTAEITTTETYTKISLRDSMLSESASSQGSNIIN